MDIFYYLFENRIKIYCVSVLIYGIIIQNKNKSERNVIVNEC